MAIYNVEDLFPRAEKTDLTYDKIFGNSAEHRARAPEVVQSLLAHRRSYLERTMIAAKAVTGQNQELMMSDQFVIEHETNIDTASVGFTRKVDLNLESHFVAGFHGVVPWGPIQQKTALGRGGKTGLSVTKEYMWFGSFRITEERAAWQEEAFNLDILLKDISSLEEKATAKSNIDDKCCIFSSLPSYFGEADELTPTEKQEHLYPVFGAGLNATYRLERIIPNGKQIDTLTEDDVIDEIYLDLVVTQLNTLGIIPLNIEGDVDRWGILVSTQDIQRFVSRLGTQSRSMINLANQGSGDFKKHEFYRNMQGAVLSEWGQFLFFINNNVSADPTVIKFTKEQGNRDLEVPRMQFVKEWEQQRYNGTAFSPRAEIVGLINGGQTNLPEFIDFDGLGNIHRQKLKAGTETANDHYLLVDSRGGVNLDFFHDLNGGSQVDGRYADTAHLITALEDGLITSNMDIDTVAGMIQIGDRYQAIGDPNGPPELYSPASNTKWKIIYSGPFNIGVVNKNLVQTANVIDQHGSAYVKSVMGLRIQAIYRFDEGANAWEADPVTDADLNAELALIKDYLDIDTNDNLAETFTDVNGTPKLAPQALIKRSAHYFNASRSVIFGQGVMIKTHGIAPFMGQDEYQDYGAFHGTCVLYHEGRKLFVDRYDGRPKGAVIALYYGGHNY